MTTARNSNRDGLSYLDQKKDGDYFQKHNECMRQFRLAHPEVETTGSKNVRTADRLILVPMQKVRLAKYSQN